MWYHIKSSIRLCLNLTVFTTFLIFGSYNCSGQEKEVSFKDLVQSTDSLNSPIYLFKGNPFSGVVSDYYEHHQFQGGHAYGEVTNPPQPGPPARPHETNASLAGTGASHQPQPRLARTLRLLWHRR